nr:MAG: L1 protein [Hydrurga leptonyx papillomavirus 2]
MAFWLPSSNKLYLPPSPVTRTSSTDEYVIRTSIFYHANSDRLLTVGNPYFEIKDGAKVVVPKVSSNQYRVFRVRFPDPNKFALTDSTLYDPEKERLVWACRGLEIGRGGPLGIGVSGHPLFNRYEDTENPTRYSQPQSTDNRQNVSFDTKQTQLFMIGCAPPLGEHWAKGLRCDSNPKDNCPPLELVNSVIQDGDMVDIGYGALDFKALQENRSDVPLDINDSICKYPDYLKMSKEHYGDSLFFYGRREQMYTRHFFSRAGETGEPVPDGKLKKAAGGQAQNTLGSTVYFGTPSGSLVTSDAQLFNRPYWLMRAQGQNNGICWENQLFVTVVDTTRGTNFTLSVANGAGETYEASKYKVYTRHVEEFELSFVMQLCKVPLTPDVLALIYTMNPDILESWNLGVNPPPSGSLEDTYRYLQSLATRCPDKQPPKERVDPYDKYNFWDVDLSERLSLDLDQFPLGRKFLYQSGQNRPRPRKTLRISNTVSSTKRVKRRKKQ